MGRGGRREPGIDPETGERKKLGRPKSSRPTNSAVAGRVLAQAKAEQLWLSLISLEKERLGIGENGKLLPSPKGTIDGPDYQGRFSIIPLVNLLRYLEDRAHGHPLTTVNHLHDKPIEHNVTVSYYEVIQKARKRAAQAKP
jgi:hypothetical protein